MASAALKKLNVVVAVAALLLPMAPCVSAPSVSGDPPAAMTLWLEGNDLKLKTSIYESTRLSSHPVLVVVLHGDLLGVWNVPPTTYHYVFADEAARRIEDVVVAAVLRPGYRDQEPTHCRRKSSHPTFLLQCMSPCWLEARTT